MLSERPANQSLWEAAGFWDPPPSFLALLRYLGHTKDKAAAKVRPTGQIYLGISMSVYDMHLVSRQDGEISGLKDTTLGGSQTRSQENTGAWVWSPMMPGFIFTINWASLSHFAINTYNTISLFVSHHFFLIEW